MGAAEPGLEAAGQSTAETLLTSLRTIADPERARHATVLDYWLSIRGDKEFPPLHDLDPLEISDAGPQSILFELIGGGQDAEIRHLGDGLAGHVGVQRLIDAPSPSLLSSIARKLPIVAISRDFLAFEENFSTATGLTRCWVTLLPLSSCGSWVDYVYAFVTVETSSIGGSTPAVDRAPVEPAAETGSDMEAELAAARADQGETGAGVVQDQAEPDQPDVVPETANQAAQTEELADEPDDALAAPDPAPPEAVVDVPSAEQSKTGPGFSKLIEGIANLAGFYGQGIKAADEVSIDHPSLQADESEDPPATEASADSEAELQSVSEGELSLEQEASGTSRDPQQASEPAPLTADSDQSEGTGASPQSIEDEPAPPEESPPQDAASQEAPVAEAPAEDSGSRQTSLSKQEGKLQDKLTEVRARADEAREAQARATRALHEGLSAAYDFALDAETSPEEYLRLVEAEGMKIQLRAPMAPVASLAFNGLCDEPTIRQFEAVLAWALKEELPRGTLIERIEQAGGIPELLNGA